VVWMNAGCMITYNEQFGVTHRNTTMTGVAFFDVKESATPFIIHTNGMQIKVLGTAFNVRSYPNENSETSLLRGKVEITLDKRPGEKYLLRPQEKLIVGSSRETMVYQERKQEPIVMLRSVTPSGDSSFVETSWVDNKLIFQDDYFADLAVKLERWYGVKIEFQNEMVARQRISGTITTETIQQAMEALQITTPFHYSLKSNHIIITR
jgi:transmembrane sensor